MKYFTVLLTLFVTLSSQTLASDAHRDQGQNNNPRQVFKATFIDTILPKKLASYSAEEINAFVVSSEKVSWSTYSNINYLEHHKAALRWLTSLVKGEDYGQLHNLGNMRKDFLRLKKAVPNYEIAGWGTAIRNYTILLQTCAIDKPANLPPREQWSKSPYHFACNGIIKKHNVLLINLATAYIKVMEDLKEKHVNEALAKYDAYMTKQQNDMSASSKNS